MKKEFERRIVKTPEFLLSFPNIIKPQKPLASKIEDGIKYIAQEKDLYPGCVCEAELMTFSYDTHGYKGVGFVFLFITKLRDNEWSFTRAEMETLQKIQQ